jgi:prepilin-type N-terminal cleavage/methylation domain-containing protein
MKNARSGFTLIEALVAITILGIALAMIIPAFLANLQLNSKSEDRTYAVAAAQQVLENLRLADPKSLPTTGSDPAINVIVAGHIYTVTPSYCTITTFCTATSKHIRVDVSFNSKIVYTTETVFTKIANQ